MKTKRLWAAVVGTIFGYYILGYIFMWPPVVFPAPYPSAHGNACINNLRQFDGAINEWALENNKTNGTPVTLDDIKPFTKLTSRGELPTCPVGGQYQVTVVGAPPTCTLATNTQRLQWHYLYWTKNAAHYHRLP